MERYVCLVTPDFERRIGFSTTGHLGPITWAFGSTSYDSDQTSAV